MPKVLCLGNPDSPAGRLARELAPEGWETVLIKIGPEAASLAPDCDFILSYHSGVPDDVIRAAGKARLIQLCSAGYDQVNLTLAGEMGIPVANNGGANAIPVAEMAITLMLATYRHLITLDREIRGGGFMPDWGDGRDTYELSGKTIGIVGAGRIGSMLAKILQGFEPTILYTDPVRSEIVENLSGRRVDLDTLLQKSDIVTLHVPLLDTTRQLIGARELGLMKPSAVLINTSRGEVVDETALVKVLERNDIWGAGIDVFEKEPTDPDNRLFELENCVVAPHVAGKTYESFPRRVSFSFANMQRVWDGKPPESTVTPE